MAATLPIPAVARKPELVEVAQLALSELEAVGVVVVDTRATPPRIVACEGPDTHELVVDPAGLRALAADLDGRHLAVGEHAGLHIVSVEMDAEEGNPIGSLHVVYRDAPREQVGRLARAFARHMGLVLSYSCMRRERDRRAMRNERLSALDDLARSPHAVDEMTEMVTEAVQPLTGATASCITIWDEERDILRAFPGAFGATDRALPASITGPVSNQRSLAARVFATGRPYVTNRAKHDPGLHQAYVDVFDLHRVLAVPLNNGGRRVGVLILVNKPTDFTPEDIVAAESVASRVAMAVELARSVRNLRTQQRLETVLATTAVSVARGQSVEECLLPAFERLAAVTDASLVGLIPLNGLPLIWRAKPESEPLEERFIRDATDLVHRSVGAFPQKAGDPGWAALHAPVELYGERTAALSVLRQNGEPFGRDEAQVVVRLASIAALAWATERYQHQLAEIARLRERERIADELHDRVAQILFAAQLGLDSLLESADDAAIDKQRIREVRSLLTKGDGAIRDVIGHLSVTPDASVTRRLRLEVEGVEEEFGVAVHIEIGDEQAINSARRAVADCMVKVAREATVNAAKHAGPCRITLRAGPDGHGRLVLSVLDDGLGCSATEQRHDGRGMQQLRRAVRDSGGSLRVSRGEGSFGTRLTAAFPLGDCLAHT